MDDPDIRKTMQIDVEIEALDKESDQLLDEMAALEQEMRSLTSPSSTSALLAEARRNEMSKLQKSIDIVCRRALYNERRLEALKRMKIVVILLDDLTVTMESAEMLFSEANGDSHSLAAMDLRSMERPVRMIAAEFDAVYKHSRFDSFTDESALYREMETTIAKVCNDLADLIRRLDACFPNELPELPGVPNAWL